MTLAERKQKVIEALQFHEQQAWAARGQLALLEELLAQPDPPPLTNGKDKCPAKTANSRN